MKHSWSKTVDSKSKNTCVWLDLLYKLMSFVYKHFQSKSVNKNHKMETSLACLEIALRYVQIMKNCDINLNA